MLTLEKFTIGVGDRFAHQASAQLRAFQQAATDGVEVVPVWNKSNREHTFVGSEPQSVYDAAHAAVKSLGWEKGWHVDADHIRLETVARFLPCSDFFTIDVADSIAQPTAPGAVEAFVDRHPELVGRIEIAGIDRPFETTRAEVERIAGKFLLAVQDAGKIYRHIAAAKGEGNIIAEVSMDETDSPQTPPELTVAEYVLLGRTPHLGYLATERAEDRVAAARALARLELTAFAHRLLASLSGGELQRAVLARALAQEAPILLLDEPTSALDLGRQQQALELVHSLRDDGLTIVSAMHDLTLAGQYSDRLVLLDAGRVVDEGPAEHVLSETNIARFYGASVRVLEEDGAVFVLPHRG